MCEYCGCQDVTAIGQLTREHDAVVDLIGEARSAHRDGHSAVLLETAREIARILGPHTRVEEEGLFPALAADFPEQIAALHDEHRQIEAALAETGSDAPPAGWQQRLLDALNLLRRHILKEQDGVFPAALTGLSTAQWEAVDEARERAGSALERL